MKHPLLEIQDLNISFGRTNVVRNVSLRLEAGQTLCVVGESGSGKSVTAMSLLKLLPTRAKTCAAKIHFNGKDISGLKGRGLQKLRGGDIAMIFQDPMSSLNPAFTIGNQIGEALRRHTDLSHSDVRKRVLEALDMVRIPEARARVSAYPHELSGGMRQRVMIAMALACRPKLLIADEPTTALDVTIQAQILSLIDELKDDLGTGVLFITHDLGVVGEIADDVAVMYAGEIVEKGSADQVLSSPAHAYTVGLMGAKPQLGNKSDRLTEIPGTVPHLDARPPGCQFAPRCFAATGACTVQKIATIEVGPSHMTRCIHHQSIRAIKEPTP
ncbi:ABC transporter ATP-binding protein [Aestuariicoccus sp. MJ-SS9]|uniref:ABC transporter ATP-binding protein n=1 Tax=Aestuariicoccus sp. MJ-SS9 TaxID=3079855 RepID=UPI002914F149|nr:ABC transporter ATP-binding protein [Aestuariicoccus sp. MJ-SS9]MDU8913406.1 ABC transporter ATP-binding protein [Aestuariicoccus sp. MJ-SS9]